ncbi:hypothetical protein AURDEDRAFT_161105 [Auricularia subglabra TFB-10046 SS5]|nr:hypothetical protein AURDEDRAFT_161105 [Auricularia subglabra TFB-10046 SS5]
MLIPVNLSLPTESSSGPSLPPQLVNLGSSEVALIEMQGSLQVTEGEDRAPGLNVGTLRIDTNDKPTLRIGAHLLEGKVVSLSKPLVLLVRNREGDPDVEYNTVTLVKKKIVFSKRPMPIPNARPPS